MKKVILLLLVILMILPAQAEHAYELTGTTAFLYAETVYAEAGGKLSSFSAMAGDYVSKAEVMGEIESVKVFAPMDGTVRGVFVEEGESVNGEAFLIEPKEKYKLLASGSYAYDSPDNKIVHPGETVYASCVTDGSHLAIGYVADVDGEEFTVYTTHGNLYVGEAVVLYRSEQRNYTSRIARATVYAADAISVESGGTITKMYAGEGDRVEKGELLFEYIQDGGSPAVGAQVVNPKDGVITAVHVSEGETVSVSQALYDLADPARYGVIVNVSEKLAASLSKGDSVTALFLSDDTETKHAMKVLTVSPFPSEIDGENVYEVNLIFEELPDVLYEGMTVNVMF